MSAASLVSHDHRALVAASDHFAMHILGSVLIENLNDSPLIKPSMNSACFAVSNPDMHQQANVARHPVHMFQTACHLIVPCLLAEEAGPATDIPFAQTQWSSFHIVRPGIYGAQKSLH